MQTLQNVKFMKNWSCSCKVSIVTKFVVFNINFGSAMISTVGTVGNKKYSKYLALYYQKYRI